MALQPLFFSSGLAKKFNEFHQGRWDGFISGELPFAISKIESVLEDERNKLIPCLVKVNHQTGEVLYGSEIELGEINLDTGERKLHDWARFNDNFAFTLEDLILAEQIFRSQEEIGLDIWTT